MRVTVLLACRTGITLSRFSCSLIRKSKGKRGSVRSLITLEKIILDRFEVHPPG